MHRQAQSQRFGADLDPPDAWTIFSAAFDSEGVCARRQLDVERMRRERDVHFDCIGVDPVLFLVTNGWAGHRGGFGEGPAPSVRLDVQARWNQLFASRINDFAGHRGGLHGRRQREDLNKHQPKKFPPQLKIPSTTFPCTSVSR